MFRKMAPSSSRSREDGKDVNDFVSSDNLILTDSLDHPASLSSFIDIDTHAELKQYIVEYPFPRNPVTVSLKKSKKGQYVVDACEDENNVCEGDILIAINGETTKGKTLPQVEKLLNAPHELKLHVKVLSGSEEDNLPVTMMGDVESSEGENAGGQTSDRDADDERESSEDDKEKAEQDKDEKDEPEEEPEEKVKRNSLLDKPKQEFYDVLDKSKKKRMDKKMEKRIVKRGQVPPIPEGDWKWRPAKFIEEKNSDGSIVWDMEYTDEKGGKTSIDMEEDDDCVASFESKTKAEMLHEYEKGPIDCLDYYFPKNKKRRMQKWRKAEVLAVEKYWVRIHFAGWNDLYDEWFHVVSQAHRLAPFKQETERLLRERLAREKKFKECMSKDHKLQVIEMSPDGNCLFRTVSHQIYGTPEKHKIVRAECCKYMLQNKARFKHWVVEPIGKHVKKMKKQSEWGSEPEIRAMEELYDRPMEIYQCIGDGSNTKTMFFNFKGDLPDEDLKEVEPVRLSYHGKCHYNSVVPEDLKMNMEKSASWKAPPKRKTKLIMEHRLNKLKDAARAEEERKLAEERKKKEEEEKKKDGEDASEEKEEENEDAAGESTADGEEIENENAEESEDAGNQADEDDEQSAKETEQETVNENETPPPAKSGDVKAETSVEGNVEVIQSV